MTEVLKSADRSYNLQNTRKQSLSGGCDYYRVHINSQMSQSGDDNDKTYFLGNLLPNARFNLMDGGKWEVFLEQFEMQGFTQASREESFYDDVDDDTRFGIQVALPTLLTKGKDFLTTSAGGNKRCDPTAIVAHIPHTRVPRINDLYEVDATADAQINATPHAPALATFTVPQLHDFKPNDIVYLAPAAFVDKHYTIASVTINTITVTITGTINAQVDAQDDVVISRRSAVRPTENYGQMVVYRRHIQVLGNQIGHQIDPQMLSQGQLRIVLLDDRGELLKGANSAGGTVLQPDVRLNDLWYRDSAGVQRAQYRATLLFVHKH